MRGFSTANSIFVDNIRDLGGVSRDLFNIEQVEVVKGPAGADNGRGAPTGYINMVTKQPMLENAYSGTVAYGTGNQKRVTADLNRQIDSLNGAAFRLNLLKQDSGVPGRDRVENNRWGIAPSLAFGLGTPTRVLFNYLHLERDNVPDAGIPTIGAPGFFNATTVGKNARLVARSNYYGMAGDYDKSTSDMFTATFEHDLSADVTIRNVTRYGKTRQNYLIGSPYTINGSDANPANWTVSRLLQTRDQENEIFTNQTNAIIRFRTGPVKHSMTTGLEFIREKQTTVLYAGPTLAAANLYAPDPYAPASVQVRPSGGRNEGTTNTIGAYLFDTLELSPSFQLNAGIRLDRYTTDFNGIAVSTAASNPGLPVGTLVPTTLFLSDPGDYQGGELVVHDTYGAHEVKLPAGDLILYPSTSRHEVTPVTQGSRVSAFFWTQSMIRDDHRRGMLFDLDRAIHALRQRHGDSEETVVLAGHYHNLLRLWAET